MTCDSKSRRAAAVVPSDEYRTVPAAAADSDGPGAAAAAAAAAALAQSS